jgi:hypothetical protein
VEANIMGRSFLVSVLLVSALCGAIVDSVFPDLSSFASSTTSIALEPQNSPACATAGGIGLVPANAFARFTALRYLYVTQWVCA